MSESNEATERTAAPQEPATPQEPAEESQAQQETQTQPTEVMHTVQPSDDERLELSAEDIKPAVEAILMATDQPLQPADIAKVLSCTADEVEAILTDLRDGYNADGRGFELRRTARGWQYASRAEYEQAVQLFVTDGQTARLSQAALESLAIIAYKQPITRAQVAAIRGVNSDGVIRSLSVRGLIREVGTDPESHAAVLGTSGLFLDYMGIDSLGQLPPLAPFLPADSAANSDESLEQ